MKPLGILVGILLITSIFTVGVLPRGGESRAKDSGIILEDGMEDDFEEINEFDSPETWSERHGVTFKNSTSQNISADIDHRSNIDLVWQDNRESNWNIYYVKLDGEDGEKLINDFRVSDNERTSFNPKVVSHSDHIYVVWQEKSDGEWKLYFSKLRYSDEEVTTIIERKFLTSIGKTGSKNYTFVRGEDAQFHLTYEKENNGKQNVFYRRINGEGENIISPFQITETADPSYDPKLEITEDGKLHLLWVEPIERNNGIFYTKIDYAGNTLVERKRLTVVNRLDRYDLAKNDEGSLHMVFDDDRYHSYKRDVIYQKLSSDGKILIDDTLITDREDDSNSFLPSICKGENGYMYVSWSDSRDYRTTNDEEKNISNTPHEIYIQKIDSEGETAKQSERVTGTFSYSANPIMLTDHENQQQLLWEDSRRDVLDIYHKQTIKPDLSVNDMNVDPENPDLNSSVNITAQLENLGQSSINTTGRLYRGKDQEVLLKEISISLSGRSEDTFSFNFTTDDEGTQNLTFIANEEKEPTEKSYENNRAEEQIFVRYYSLSLDPINNYTAVDPGGSGKFSYNITNDGNVKQDFDVSFELPEKLEVDHDSIEEDLDSGETRRYNFTVKSSEGYRAGEYDIRMTVESLDKDGLEITENFTLKVDPIYDISLSVEKKAISDPGEMNYTVDMSVTNLANTDQEILIYVANGTNYAFVEGSMMILEPDQTRNAVLNISNYQSIEGEELEILVVAESVDSQEVTDSAQITIEGSGQAESESWFDMIPWFWIGIGAAVIVGVFVALRIYYTYVS